MIPGELFPYFFMNRMSIGEILKSNTVIAIVGFSDNHTRPSNRIGRYLLGNGYNVYGINPKLENKIVDEIRCFASLKDLPVSAGIINIFRRSEFLYDLMKEIIQLKLKPKVVWTQIGVISREAGSLAEENGILYIENKCIMVEHTLI